MFDRNFEVGILETGNRWCKSSGIASLLNEYMPITLSSSILTSFYYSVKIRQKAPFLHTVKAYATQATPTS